MTPKYVGVFQAAIDEFGNIPLGKAVKSNLVNLPFLGVTDHERKIRIRSQNAYSQWVSSLSIPHCKIRILPFWGRFSGCNSMQFLGECLSGIACSHGNIPFLIKFWDSFDIRYSYPRSLIKMGSGFGLFDTISGRVRAAASSFDSQLVLMSRACFKNRFSL